MFTQRFKPTMLKSKKKSKKDINTARRIRMVQQLGAPLVQKVSVASAKPPRAIEHVPDPQLIIGLPVQLFYRLIDLTITDSGYSPLTGVSKSLYQWHYDHSKFSTIILPPSLLFIAPLSYSYWDPHTEPQMFYVDRQLSRSDRLLVFDPFNLLEQDSVNADKMNVRYLELQRTLFTIAIRHGTQKSPGTQTREKDMTLLEKSEDAPRTFNERVKVLVVPAGSIDKDNKKETQELHWPNLEALHLRGTNPDDFFGGRILQSYRRCAK